MPTLFILSFLALASSCGGDGETALLGPPGAGGDNVVPLSCLGGIGSALFNDMAVAGDRVYACTASDGMRIARVGGSGSIEVFVDRVTFPGGAGCRAVAVAPDGAVFAGGESGAGSSWVGGLVPGGRGEMAGSLTLSGGLVETLAATQSHVYAALGTGGIAVLGRNDGDLAEVGSLAAGFDRALGVASWGERLLVANGLSGVVVVDVTDPAKPVVERSFPSVGTARRIALAGGLAYVAGVSGGIGIHEPESGELVGKWVSHGSAVDLAVDAGGYLLVANLEDFCVLDVAYPSEPTIAATETLPGRSGAAGRVVAVHPYVGDGNLGLPTGWSSAVVAEWSALFAVSYEPTSLYPDIHLSRTSIDFGDVATLKKSKGITVQNLGAMPLDIESLDVSGTPPGHEADFEIEMDDLHLSPGDSGFLEITFFPSGADPVDAMLAIRSNDPDEAVLHVPLTANDARKVQIGDPWDPRPFLSHESGNQVTVDAQYAGRVVILAWFGTS